MVIQEQEQFFKLRSEIFTRHSSLLLVESPGDKYWPLLFDCLSWAERGHTTSTQPKEQTCVYQKGGDELNWHIDAVLLVGVFPLLVYVCLLLFSHTTAAYYFLASSTKGKRGREGGI